MPTQVMIGVVKYFENGRGVIAPRSTGQTDEPRELYFEAPNQKSGFKEGQLVRFVKEESSSRASEVAVLSENS